MSQPRTDRLAKILVHHSARIKKGDRVVIEASTAAEPLVQSLFIEILNQGGHPHLLLQIPGQKSFLLKHGTKDQLVFVDEFRHHAYQDFESRIKIHSLTNTKALENLPTQKQAWHQQSEAAILNMQMDRGAKGEFKWVTTLFPTRAYASEAGMSLAEFEDFVYRACHADRENGIEIWQGVKKHQQAALNLFAGHDQIYLSGPHIDLKLSVKDRTFINSYGIHNMPDGEIFTGPVENSADGWVHFTYPAIHNGIIVKGIKLTFEDGKVVDAQADTQQDYLLEMLDSNPGSRYLGEFAVGMNTQIDTFTGNILFDEKIGGTIHLALGAGYPETGSKNKSMIHWDMICDLRHDSEIRVDGTLAYSEGKFHT